MFEMVIIQHLFPFALFYLFIFILLVFFLYGIISDEMPTLGVLPIDCHL